MKTNYSGHEEAYRRRRDDGQVGWDGTLEAYAEREIVLTKVLAQGLAPASGRFLEIGCGAGNVSLWFAKHGFDVTGVDISPTAVSWAQERAQEAGVQATFVCANVLDMKGVLSDQAFDFLLDGHCLHCIIGEDRRRFFREAYRLLKSAGYLLIDTMCGPVKPGAIEGYDPESGCSIVHGIATRYWGAPEQIKEEIAAGNFQILDTSIELEENHGNMLVQARKGPTRPCSVRR